MSKFASMKVLIFTSHFERFESSPSIHDVSIDRSEYGILTLILVTEVDTHRNMLFQS